MKSVWKRIEGTGWGGQWVNGWCAAVVMTLVVANGAHCNKATLGGDCEGEHLGVACNARSWAPGWLWRAASRVVGTGMRTGTRTGWLLCGFGPGPVVVVVAWRRAEDTARQAPRMCEPWVLAACGCQPECCAACEWPSRMALPNPPKPNQDQGAGPPLVARLEVVQQRSSGHHVLHRKAEIPRRCLASTLRRLTHCPQCQGRRLWAVCHEGRRWQPGRFPGELAMSRRHDGAAFLRATLKPNLPLVGVATRLKPPRPQGKRDRGARQATVESPWL